MVLGDLGRKITTALQKFSRSTVIDENAIKQCLGEISNALLASDVSVKFVFKMRESITNRLKTMEAEGANLRTLIKTEVVKQLTSLLDVQRKPFVPKKGKINVVMFVGLQGCGKTTTCAKYAHYYKKKGWKVAMVCADTFRAGAFDQLKQNAARIKVPFYGSYVQTDPVAIAEQGVAQFKKQGMDLIIVDTSGRHKQEADLFDEMKQVQRVVSPDEIIFVMDSSIGQQCFAQAQAFRNAVNVGSVIITKLDGHARGGGALSAVAATESPIIFFGDGQHFDDFEPFEALSFIKRLLGQGDIKQLIQKVTDVVTPQTQAKLLEKVKKGQFSIRDLKGQFQSILKLGSLSSFMSLLPGVGTNLINKDNEKQSILKIKKFLYVMDSMTAKQLDSEVPLDESRMKRIAKGSGTSVIQVKILLQEHKKLKGLIGKVGQANLGKSGDAMNMMRNPNQMMSKLAGMVDPKMLGQMGGAANIMNMMKQMTKNPQMAQMMKSMGAGGLGGLGGLGGAKKPKKR